MNNKIILFGTSYMGEEYLKVLKDLNQNVIVIGRDESKAKNLAIKYGFEGLGGGVSVLNDIDGPVTLAIIASSVESLKDVTVACLKKGINKILIEKPGGLNQSELSEIKNQAESNQKIWIAYNRRYYASTLKMKEILASEEIQGCFFDFTDREKDILYEGNSKEVVKRWGFANSSHVIDMAFSLIGFPKKIDCDISGYMKEHPSGSIFVGKGESNCLFSYFATWQGGGRWDVEISTNKGRYKLSPLEELSFCKKDQFNWISIELDDEDDKKFKPGLKKMIVSILNEEKVIAPSLDEQIEFSKIINKIFGYED